LSARFSTALEKVYALMRDGRWHTLAAIALSCGCSESGASARLRDLRKPEFRQQYPNRGVETRRRTDALFEYRLLMDSDVSNH
jgi:hypothetical protein